MQTAPEVLDAAIFGSAIHLVVPQALAAIPGLREYLAERGISVARIEPIRPTLEDVFVSLTSTKVEERSTQ